jgi:HAE1 family hydrophobic/amphiphilic exporter-1
MLVGLLGKNAVLIVEFAVQRQREGVTVFNAAIEGAKMRFRPILMTSFAFVAGLIPLVIAHGAGAIGNRTIGGSALGGMLFGTVMGVLVIPGLYYIFATMAGNKRLIRDAVDEPLSENFVRNTEEQQATLENIRRANKILSRLLGRNRGKKKKKGAEPGNDQNDEANENQEH